MSKNKGVDFKKLAAKSKQLNFTTVNADKGGEEIGLMDGTKFEFKEVGDCIIGVLLEREYREKPYKSHAYQMENLEDMWFFWGTTVLDSRTNDIALPALLKIECQGKKTPASGGLQYMDFQIFEYPLPQGFDPEKHVAALDPEDGEIKFFDRPVRDVPESGDKGPEPK